MGRALVLTAGCTGNLQLFRQGPRECDKHTVFMLMLPMKSGAVAMLSPNAQIPGRMSDSAVAGAGAYAETGIGGCGSTGDGDIHLRFLPCYQVDVPTSLPRQLGHAGIGIRQICLGLKTHANPQRQ